LPAGQAISPGAVRVAAFRLASSTAGLAVIAKRAILEPDHILTAEEIAARVCEHFGAARLPYLKSKAVKEVNP
jgi:hypothetical protein